MTNTYFILDDQTTARAICDFDALTATTEAEAIREASRRWDHLSKADKAKHDSFCVCFGELNEDDAPEGDNWNVIADLAKAVPGFAYAVELMDDEIRESIHADGIYTTEAAFLNEYRRRHLAKYGEEFTF